MTAQQEHSTSIGIIGAGKPGSDFARSPERTSTEGL
jgi:hypothetical protein